MNLLTARSFIVYIKCFGGDGTAHENNPSLIIQTNRHNQNCQMVILPYESNSKLSPDSLDVVLFLLIESF